MKSLSFVCIIDVGPCTPCGEKCSLVVDDEMLLGCTGSLWTVNQLSTGRRGHFSQCLIVPLDPTVSVIPQTFGRSQHSARRRWICYETDIADAANAGFLAALY